MAISIHRSESDEQGGQAHSEQSFVRVWKPLPADLDVRIVGVITAPPPAHLSAQAAHQAKEQQLGELFASLSVSDALALHRRLTLPASDDPVPAAFERLTGERRERLARFLGDARRRAAQAKPRR